MSFRQDKIIIILITFQRCILADNDKRMLVFEDLREQDYRNADRANGLDGEHIKLALVNLAKWHAGTATLLLNVCYIFL